MQSGVAESNEPTSQMKIYFGQVLLVLSGHIPCFLMFSVTQIMLSIRMIADGSRSARQGQAGQLWIKATHYRGSGS
jgi:hypothetical protein